MPVSVAPLFDAVPTSMPETATGFALSAARAALSELEHFLSVLARRIDAEAVPLARAAWRAHERATLAEIVRLRRVVAGLD